MRTTRPGESLLLLLGVLNLFDKRKIAYAVTGPLPRLPIAQFASMDVDRILSAARRESLTVEQDFQAAGFHTQLTRGDFEDPVPGLLRISDVYGNQVDLLLGLRGLESTAFSRLVEAPFHGRMVRFIGREDFMARKAFAGRPLHLIDAARAISPLEHPSTLPWRAVCQRDTAGKHRKRSIVF